VKGIEPSCPAWEAGVLPLNYTRKNEEVKVTGEKGIVKDHALRIWVAAFFGCLGRVICTHGRTVNTTKTLPAAQLFREGTARAIGGVSETEVFVNLEQSLLACQCPKEITLPRIVGKQACRCDPRGLIGKLRA
jgi:predicted RNA-binding protein YlqC (UPF0109 family)